MRKYLFLLFGIFFISFASAIQAVNPYSYNTLEIQDFNITVTSANISNVWNTTSLGELTDANPIQFESVGGSLSIMLSWLNSQIVLITSNLFDQSLNTTDDVTFNNLSLTGNLSIDGVGNIIEFTAPTDRVFTITGPEGSSDVKFETNQAYRFITDGLARLLITDALTEVRFGFEVDGETLMNDNLNVTGNVTIEEDLNVTGDVEIQGDTGIGIGPGLNPLTLFQDDAATGTSSGLIIQQDGGGDSRLAFVSDIQAWAMGIDKSSDYDFKIAMGDGSIGGSTAIAINTNGKVRIVNQLGVATSFADGTAPFVVRGPSNNGMALKAQTGPRIFFDEGNDGAETQISMFGVGAGDNAFLMRQFDGSGTDVILDLETGGGRASVGTNILNILHDGTLKLMLDNAMFFQGLGDDVSQTFNGSDRVVNAEVGSPNNYWTGFAGYIFDNDLTIGGDLNVTGNLNVETIIFANNATITDNSTCLKFASPDGSTTFDVCNL